MALQILIGGVDYTQYVEPQSLKITSNIAVNQDRASFDVIIPQKVVPRPMGGQEVIINNGSIREFAGVIQKPQEEAYATDRMCYHTQCRDYTVWFNKKVVTNTYNNMTPGAIVRDIVNNFTIGFTIHNVQDVSNALAQKKFDHIFPEKCMQELSDIVGGYQWWIDYYKDVHFSPTMIIPSFLPNNTLLVDSDTQNYSNLILEEDISQLRNQIYLLGYKLPAQYTITQSFVCDGQNNTFYTTYEPKHTINTIVVTLGGTPQAKKLDIAAGLPNSQLVDGTCYIYYKNMSFRFNNAPAQGTVLNITYCPMFEMVNMYNDPNSMALMAQRDGQDGIYEYAVRDQKLTSLDAGLANTRGQLELIKYGYPHYTGQFDSFTQGWQAGQYFYLTSNNRMDGIFQNTPFYVIKVDKSIVNHPANGVPTLKYTVYISNTPFDY